MNKFFSSFIILSMLSSSATADCDFSEGITQTQNGYLYTKECHVKVGKTVQDLKDRTEQVQKMQQAIDLKDLALQKADERVTLWQESTFKLEDRVNTIEKMNDTNKTLYFVLGIAFTSLAVWGAGQLSK